MITLTLTRTSKTGNAVRGSIVLPFTQYPCSDREEQDIAIKTLENADFIIPAGTYPLKRTYSYKFKKLLPILEDVPDREGIRILKGVPDGCFTSGGESGGNSRTYDLAERYRSCDLFAEREEGCILTDMYGQSTLDIMLNRLNEFYNEEEIALSVVDAFDAGSGSGQ